MRLRASLTGFAVCFAVAQVFATTGACAQFYKDKTLTLLVNYGAGGNADIEARLFQQYLSGFVPGKPNVIVQNVPGAGGINAINMLGLNVGSRADGLTLGYFTFGPISSIADDPALKVDVSEFRVVGAMKSWALAYGRKDIPPGITKPSDLAKAKKVFIGGYSRSSLHDTRLRFAMEILGVPYQMVTGFQTTSMINKAMLQNELNITGSTLPGYQTQAVPQLVNAGIAVPLFQFPVIGKDGKPAGNPALTKQGIPRFDELYQEAFGKPPSGPKWEAMLLTTHLGSQMQRLIVFPKGTPDEPVNDMRGAFQKLVKDEAFATAYRNVTHEEPDVATADEVEPMLKRMKDVSPEVKKVIKESIAE